LFFNSSFAAGEALQSDPPLEARISMAQAMWSMVISQVDGESHQM
jgi:hypothetical protein